MNFPDKSPIVRYVDHRQAAIQRAAELGFDPKTLPEPGVHLATEHFNVATHRAATHIDAPWHYGPVCNGLPARTIDDLPVHWFIGRGVVLDCSVVEVGQTITGEFLADLLRNAHIILKPFDIVLLRTDSDKWWGTSDYEWRHPVVARDAIELLLDAGVKVVGIDAYSMDRRIRDSLEVLDGGDKSGFLPIHMLGRQREFSMIEKLAHLSDLPSSGSVIVCSPVSVVGGSGGWCRAFALLPTESPHADGDAHILDELVGGLIRE